MRLGQVHHMSEYGVPYLQKALGPAQCESHALLRFVRDLYANMYTRIHAETLTTLVSFGINRTRQTYHILKNLSFLLPSIQRVEREREDTH